MDNFLNEFNKRVEQIKDGTIRPKQVEEDLNLYRIVRHTSSTAPADVMWNLPINEAEALLKNRFVSHLKHEDGEEIMIWYKLVKQDNF